jgi:hypothetical protein
MVFFWYLAEMGACFVSPQIPDLGLIPLSAKPHIFYHRTARMKHLLSKVRSLVGHFMAKPANIGRRLVQGNFFSTGLNRSIQSLLFIKSFCKFAGALSLQKSSGPENAYLNKNVGSATRESANIPHLRKVRNCD